MTESDADLVERTRQGDLAAYGTLVARYERSVRSVALAQLSDTQLSEDAAQEAFVAAYRALRDLRDASRFGPWLMQIARRAAVRHRRVRNSSREIVSGGADVDAFAEEIAPVDREAEDRRDRLLAAIERLPEQERLVVASHYFDGHPLREIAAMSGDPIGTVTKRLSRAYERLRRWLVKPEETSHERT